MLGPGLVGVWLDRRWGSSLCTPVGFLLGMALATTALVAIAQKLTPPARGKPLPFANDESAGDGDQDGADGGSSGPGEAPAGGRSDDAAPTP